MKRQGLWLLVIMAASLAVMAAIPSTIPDREYQKFNECLTGITCIQTDVQDRAGRLLGTVTDNQGTGAAGTSAWPVANIQGATLFNSQTTGAANTAVTVTITAAAGVRAHLQSIDARCSAGTSTLTIENPAGTTKWSLPAGAVGTANFSRVWDTSLTGETNVNLVITLSTCGVGNTGTLIVQADRY